MEFRAGVPKSLELSTVLRRTIFHRLEKLVCESAPPLSMWSTKGLSEPFFSLVSNAKSVGGIGIPPRRCRFQVAADDRLRVGENGAVPHMDYLRVEINIRPHETANLAAPHTGLEGNQTKEICPCSEYRIQKLS